MGCSSSNMTTEEATKQAKASSNGRPKSTHSTNAEAKYPTSEAFVITFDSTTNKSEMNPISEEVEKEMKPPPEPPERLQKLLNASNKQLTLEDLEEKLNRADQRRQEYLQQKLDAIQKAAQMAQSISEKQTEIDESALDDEYPNQSAGKSEK